MTERKISLNKKSFTKGVEEIFSFRHLGRLINGVVGNLKSVREVKPKDIKKRPGES